MMQKREIKNAVEELSNNLIARIKVITQDVLDKDKREDGEFLQQRRFDNEFDLPRALFYVILTKVLEEFYYRWHGIEIKQNVKDTLNKVKKYLGVEIVEHKSTEKSEETDPKTT